MHDPPFRVASLMRDFAAVLNHLGAERRSWLKGALADREPTHPWLKSL